LATSKPRLSHPLLEAIEQGVLLLDGAMGTLLHERGVPASACLEQVNLDNPDLVRFLHVDYIQAGADIIETNTFSANRVLLARHGLGDRTREINARAVDIARRAREQLRSSVFIAGAIGPIGVGVPSGGDVSLKEARQAFAEQVQALSEAGADLILIETFPTLAEAREALLAVRDTTDLPVAAHLTFQSDGRTWAGEEPGEVAKTLHSLGADVVGVNCVSGPQAALEIIEKMAAATRVKLSAMPNAGQPRLLERGLKYPATPESFGEYVPRLVAAGASIVGGCCGTTPEHIAAMHQALAAEAPPPAEEPVWVEPEAAGPEPETLREKLAAGRFVVSVEIDPPRGLNPRRALEGAAMLKEAGVDCINVGDSPRAQIRMSPVAMALLLHQRVEVDTIVHFTTRDRNLMALQSDFIGAHVLGLRNILCLRGDPPTGGGFLRAVGVWDVSPVGMIRVLKGLNEGIDWAGNTLSQPTSFFIGAAANPTAPSVEAEMRLLRRKVEAGADFIMTQAVYDVAACEKFLKAASRVGVPILVGIMPLHSHRHAEFLHNELPGIVIPDELRQRMRQAGERGLAEGMALSRELLKVAQELAQGVYLMPSFGRYDAVAELVTAAKE
jgi:methionine synthase I (cobalamin-dependent)/5,10-methylenetetrahydrofolate reductase